MTWEHIAVQSAVAVVVGAVVLVGGGWQMHRILARFDAKTAEPELPSWSESIGWDPAEQLRTILRQAADELWRERMVADLTGPDPLPFLAELVNRHVLAIEPATQRRELEGATS